MPEVVIGQCHGGWSAKHGYVAIPSGTKVFLFQDPGEKMWASVADGYASSTADQLREMQSRAEWVLEPGDVVYDYVTASLKADEVSFFTGAMDGVEVVGGGWDHLSDIMRQYQGNSIYWFACQGFSGKHDSTEEIRRMLQSGRVKSEANNFTVVPFPRCDFMDDEQLTELLGNPRPESLTEIEKSEYWTTIFESWITLQPGDVQAAYAAYLKDPTGPGRETLKKSGPNGDLRHDFYKAVGKVKDEIRPK